MKAARFHYFSDCDGVSIEEIERPTPKADEVLIRVEATGLHPSDLRVVQGLTPGIRLPLTPGCNFSGVVVDGPADVIGWEVWGAGSEFGSSRDGTHAEYVVFPKNALSRKPANLSFVEAASVGVDFVASYVSLVESVKLRRAEFLVVNGAIGGVGWSALQIAHWLGARTIALDDNLLSDYGLDRFASDGVYLSDPRHLKAVKQHLQEVTDAGPDVTFDCLGGFYLEQCLSLLRPGGRHIAAGPFGANHSCFDLRSFNRRKLSIFGIECPYLKATASAAVLDLLRPAFEAGNLSGGGSLELRELREAPTLYSNRTTARHRRVVFVLSR